MYNNEIRLIKHIQPLNLNHEFKLLVKNSCTLYENQIAPNNENTVTKYKEEK